MSKNHLLQNLAYLIIVIIGLLWLLSVGASVILPFIFATFFAIFLYPIDRFVLDKIHIQWLSIVLTYLSILTPIFIIVGLFYLQVTNIIESLPAIGETLKQGLDQVLGKAQEKAPFLKLDRDKILSSSTMSGPLNIISQGIISTTGILAASALTFIYSFFILYYRKSFKRFIIYQFKKSSRLDIKETLTEIKETIQSYIRGLGIVMIILSVLNTLGLYIIGIDYPLFWGILGGILAIVPYVGTMIGGLLPFLYAMATTDQTWQPVAVITYYFLIQQIEGNFITPKIVGDKVNINPLVAILSLIFFGSFWGVAGILLGLPIISIVRIIFSQFENTKPIALLMSSNVHEKSEKFKSLAEAKSS